MIDAGVVVGTAALVVLLWNLGRINDVMKEVSNREEMHARSASLRRMLRSEAAEGWPEWHAGELHK